MNLKTMTLSRSDDDDQPSLVVCEGHVKAAEFNQAFKSEGWADEGEWRDEDLTHGWGWFDGDEVFHQWDLQEEDFQKPFTWVDWD